jgi:hypothetical protein
VSKSDIFVSKSVKYPYNWSFSEILEENKKCLKLNFTGPEFFSLRQTHSGASYKALYISSPNFFKVT